MQKAQLHAQTASEQWGHTVPALELVTERHRAALDQLHAAARNRQPLIVLIAEGKFEANHVLGAFISGLSEETAVVRLTKPYPEAIEGLRAITRALGFEPKDLTCSDLDGILQLFLEFQRKNRRRTFICVEQADAQPRWLLEHMRLLIELERDNRYGLSVILSGQKPLRERLTMDPLDAVREFAGRTIRLQPFTLAETGEFLRRRVEASGTADISQLFHFDAVHRIHDLSGGVPDLVGTLCFKCLQIANQQGTGPVTEQLVDDAARLLWQKPAIETQLPHDDMAGVERLSTYREKLVVSHAGKELLTHALRPGRFMIGRAASADICLPCRHVSRRHALLISSAAGLLLRDLGSTNGSFVNGVRFRANQALSPGDVIYLADCRIEYVSS